MTALAPGGARALYEEPMLSRRTARAPRCVAVFFALAFVAFTCAFPYIAGVNNPNENVSATEVAHECSGQTDDRAGGNECPRHSDNESTDNL